VRHGAAYLINAHTDGERKLEIPCERTLLGDFVGRVRGTGESLLSAEDTLLCAEACLRARQSADDKKILLFPGT
jgi:hypothetical protein